MFSTAIFVALPLLASSAYAGACVRTYTIQEGDICDKISAAKNVSTYQLATINAGVIDSTCSNLYAGQSICIGYEGEDCTTTYVVKTDDTCEGIASTAGVNTTLLHENNPQINEDCTNIYVGEVLCTLNTVRVPPAAGDFVPAASIPATAAPANPTVAAKATSSKVEESKAQVTQVVDDEDDEDLPYCDEL